MRDEVLRKNGRNELIHHFLPPWDSSSIESTRAADAWPGRQREKALPEFENLREMGRLLRECGEHLAE